MGVLFEQSENIAAAQIKMNRIRRPVKSFGIGEPQHQLYLVLALHELSLRVVVQPGPDSVTSAKVAEPIPELAGYSHVFAHEHLIGPLRREYGEHIRAKMLEKLAGFVRRSL